jgi:hypothetical protein
MKKLIAVALLALALVTQCGFAQVNATRLDLLETFTWTPDTTLDSLYYDTTFAVGLPKAWTDGAVLMDVIWDSTAGGITDSVRIQVRPAYTAVGTGTPVTYSDGAVANYQAVKIYDGNTTWTDWGLSLPLTDGDHFLCSFEMGTATWLAAQFHVEVYDSTTLRDGLFTFKINFWKR